MHSSGPPWRSAAAKMLSVGSESFGFNECCHLWSSHGRSRIASKKLSNVSSPGGSPPGIWLCSSSKVQAWSKSPELILDYINSRLLPEKLSLKTKDAIKHPPIPSHCIDEQFPRLNGSGDKEGDDAGRQLDGHAAAHRGFVDPRLGENLPLDHNVDPHLEQFLECKESREGPDPYIRRNIQIAENHPYQSDAIEHQVQVTCNGSVKRSRPECNGIFNPIQPQLNGSTLWRQVHDPGDVPFQQSIKSHSFNNDTIDYLEATTHSAEHVNTPSNVTCQGHAPMSASEGLEYAFTDTSLYHTPLKLKEVIGGTPNSPLRAQQRQDEVTVFPNTMSAEEHVVDPCKSSSQIYIAASNKHPHLEDQLQENLHQGHGYTGNDYVTQFNKESSRHNNKDNEFHHPTHSSAIKEQVLNPGNQPNHVSRLPRIGNHIRMPAYRSPGSVRVNESIIFLESLGADCSRLIRDDPTVLTCDVKSLRNLVCALECYGINLADLGRIFNLCPKILHLKPEGELKIITRFLFDEVGLLPKDFGKVIKRCPRLLVSDLDEQLRPTLKFLHTIGFSNMGQVVSNNATLLSFSVEKKLVPKLRYLESLGFAYREAVSMVIRFPAIFNYSAQENLQPKYDYLINKMGRKNRDLLAFPQYFGYSLEKRIKPRHQCLAKQGVSLSLQAILKLSEAEFMARFNCTDAADFPSRDSFDLRPRNDVKFNDSSHKSLNRLSFSHSEAPVLVGAQTC